jgi:hypothetical protein
LPFSWRAAILRWRYPLKANAFALPGSGKPKMARAVPYAISRAPVALNLFTAESHLHITRTSAQL